MSQVHQLAARPVNVRLLLPANLHKILSNFHLGKSLNGGCFPPSTEGITVGLCPMQCLDAYRFGTTNVRDLDQLFVCF